MIHNEGLWGRVMKEKYIREGSLEDWLRSVSKETFKQASIIWKTLVTTFPLVGKWLAWKVGKNNIGTIGEDP